MFFWLVKAGGMRIVQHKAPPNDRPAKDVEDCTGLTVNWIFKYYNSIFNSITNL